LRSLRRSVTDNNDIDTRRDKLGIAFDQAGNVLAAERAAKVTHEDEGKAVLGILPVLIDRVHVAVCVENGRVRRGERCGVLVSRPCR
jgi:hypothetical protein